MTKTEENKLKSLTNRTNNHAEKADFSDDSNIWTKRYNLACNQFDAFITEKGYDWYKENEEIVSEYTAVSAEDFFYM